MIRFRKMGEYGQVVTSRLPVSQEVTTTATTVTQPTPTVYPSQITDISQLFPPVAQFPQLYPGLVPQQQQPIINVMPSAPSNLPSSISKITGNIPNWAVPVLLAIAFGLLIMRSGKEQQGKLLGRY